MLSSDTSEEAAPKHRKMVRRKTLVVTKEKQSYEKRRHTIDRSRCVFLGVVFIFLGQHSVAGLVPPLSASQFGACPGSWLSLNPPSCCVLLTAVCCVWLWEFFHSGNPFPFEQLSSLCLFSPRTPLRTSEGALSLSLALFPPHFFTFHNWSWPTRLTLSSHYYFLYIYRSLATYYWFFFLYIISLTWWSIPESVLRKLRSVLTLRGGKLCVTSSRQRGKVKLSLTDSVSQSVIMVTHCVNLTCSLAAFLEETCLCLSSPLCAQPQLHFLISFFLGNVLPSLWETNLVSRILSQGKIRI